MTKSAFDKIAAGLTEAAAITKGEAKPYRVPGRPRHPDQDRSDPGRLRRQVRLSRPHGPGLGAGAPRARDERSRPAYGHRPGARSGAAGPGSRLMTAHRTGADMRQGPEPGAARTRRLHRADGLGRQRFVREGGHGKAPPRRPACAPATRGAILDRRVTLSRCQRPDATLHPNGFARQERNCRSVLNHRWLALSLAV